jgi:hypothetical protein
MKSQALFLAFISMDGVCDALGKAWFYKGKQIKGSLCRPQADSSAQDCTAPNTKDKARFYTSGAYPTYDGKCYNNETDRLSFEMGKDLDKYGDPWASCMRISSGPWCTGQTIGLDVLANSMVIAPVP